MRVNEDVKGRRRSSSWWCRRTTNFSSSSSPSSALHHPSMRTFSSCSSVPSSSCHDSCYYFYVPRHSVTATTTMTVKSKCMDGREAMPLSGSSPYYMQQRGISSSGSVAQTGLHGQAGIRPLSSSGYTIQSNITSTVSTYPVEPPATTISPHGVSMGMTGGMPSVEPVKRKRGRPRKYGPDGTMSLALSPLSSTPPQSLVPLQKRGRGRPRGSGRKQQLASLGEWIAGSAGMGFTPHIITISVGEDISSKIMSFSQLGPRAICILSASGAVSTVTLRQPSTSGGTVTYEGRFEILCLSGSYLLSEDGGTRSRTGGLSVSLASPDGRVVGGSVAGLLIAASPVQVIVGSFTYGGRKTQSKQESSDQVRPEPPTASNIGMSDKTGASSGMMHSQTPGVVSQSGWPGSRSMDIRNSHIDIDLTRG